MKAWQYFTSQQQWEKFLKDYLEEDDELLKRAIVLIYQYQTKEEQYAGETKVENNIGFSKIDAGPLGRIAQKIIKNDELTAGETAMARNKMKKYWRQLMNIAKDNLIIRQEVFPGNESDTQYNATNKNHFSNVINEMNECVNNGKPCSYGICSECPVTTGFQIRMNLEELQNERSKSYTD